MKRLVLVLLIMVGLVACAPDDPGRAGSASANRAAATTPVDLEAWCATQTPDRCIEGMVYLDWNPGRDTCVFSSSDQFVRFWELCGDGGPDVVPVTTTPTQESIDQQQAAEQNYEDEAARRLPVLDERAFDLLASTHSDGVVTAGLVLADPLNLTEAEQLMADIGAELISVWRTDYECFPGSDAAWPVATASRFAYPDGVERAEKSRQEMENSTTPVTGAHIPLNAFAVMEQAALALRDPGVLLEVVQAKVSVAALELLRNDPRIERVRLADFPTEWIDLSNLPIPTCENS
ncbi:MAG: hypothetical protein OEM81_11715 [Acidimicrobiia bacterium]|nr:hypothetical protein [Acidimicrobiia bacterium]MDH3398479.1 hypothetical protein [Acidimicrobiia bacterium]